MCGIVGALGRPGRDFREQVRKMNERLRHRGPDSEGLWWDNAAGVVLGHRRLAIIDLSPAGAQPMVSTSGRHVLTYNGELYNHAELRSALEACGYPFRGRSDTEVLLGAIEQWGLQEALRRSVGMFAAGLWDRRARRLWLFRDRMGEKPLYLARAPDALLFASELSAIMAWPGFAPTLDPRAVTAFFQLGYVPAPLTIWREARKLEPGTLLDLSIEDLDDPELPSGRGRPYWSLSEVVAECRARPLRVEDEEAIELCENAIVRSVSCQAIADVPLGVLLSGGIDSALVLALLARVSNRPIKTFTIGFAQEGFDESEAARRVARHLGSDHTALVLTAEEALAAVPRLTTVFDEPFADPSQIPTLLVATLARQDVTVALGGDGADELFGGYDRYVAAGRLASLTALPAALRRRLGMAIDALGGRRRELLLASLPAGLRERMAAVTSGDRLRKLRTVLDGTDRASFARRVNTIWDDPSELVVAPAPDAAAAEARRTIEGLELEHAMMLSDALGWLPDDILVKVDRASMAVGLETRAPFLDHRVVELAWRLPLHHKIRGGRGKWILRQILSRYVPTALLERPKMGFRPPLGAWLRGPLRAWAEDLLEARSLARSGVLRIRAVQNCWREHVEGHRERADRLWSVLIFQSWLDTWATSSPTARGDEAEAERRRPVSIEPARITP